MECEPFGLVEVKVKDYRPDKGGYMKITVRNVPGTGGLEKLELRGKANRITVSVKCNLCFLNKRCVMCMILESLSRIIVQAYSDCRSILQYTCCLLRGLYAWLSAECTNFTVAGYWEKRYGRFTPKQGVHQLADEYVHDNPDAMLFKC